VPPAPATATVNVPLARMVAGSIASLKVAVIFRFVGTATSPDAGTVEVIFGGVVSAVAPVVKLKT
jgi:hypothetical protein